MIVYADTSFLLAERIKQDANHKPALKLVEKFDAADWVWCELQAALAEDAGLVLA